MTRANLLIIDDDSDYLALLSEALTGKFNVTTTDSIAKADELASKHGPFTIALVDEHIGQEKGSDWIYKHTHNVEEKNKAAESFILYSGLATEEALLKGLSCGADDFLCKPFSLFALITKLEKLGEYQDKIHQFKNEIFNQENVINISMAQASKYGSCMQLTSRINQCFTLDKIRHEVFVYLQNMGLRGCIAFFPLNEEASFFSSTNGYCSPVEIEVMKLLHDKPRLYRFGQRTIFNHPLISILILNLEDGKTDTDIYIDALASVIECLGARMEFLMYKNSLIHVQEQISQAVMTTKHMVEISKMHQQEVMNDIVQNIGMSFHILDLNEEQEVYLTELVHGVLRKHSQDDINFIEISNLLDQALQSVEHLKSLNADQVQDPDAVEEDELF